VKFAFFYCYFSMLFWGVFFVLSLYYLNVLVVLVGEVDGFWIEGVMLFVLSSCELVC